jgi:hypothetical protein
MIDFLFQTKNLVVDALIQAKLKTAMNVIDFVSPLRYVLQIISHYVSLFLGTKAILRDFFFLR